MPSRTKIFKGIRFCEFNEFVGTKGLDSPYPLALQKEDERKDFLITRQTHSTQNLASGRESRETAPLI